MDIKKFLNSKLRFSEFEYGSFIFKNKEITMMLSPEGFNFVIPRKLLVKELLQYEGDIKVFINGVGVIL